MRKFFFVLTLILLFFILFIGFNSIGFCSTDPQDTPVPLTWCTNNGTLVTDNSGKSIIHIIHRHKHHKKRAKK